MSDKDQRFQSRIQSAIATVQAWDADPTLLAECRAMVPFGILIPTDSSSRSEYERDDDCYYTGDTLLLKRLALFFKNNMTWVNSPDCRDCGGSDMKHARVRGPESPEEREGGASRVEVYYCNLCQRDTTTFPRYNSPRKLLETQQGRCGEYANLFGLYCRAVGFETRYVLDFTDHVWTEVFLGNRWIMADSCEGVIGEPSMYEAGWGKKLNYVLAVSLDSVMDVTPRYTRKFHSDDFQARRREITSSEARSESMVKHWSMTLRGGANLSKARREELDRRDKVEYAAFDRYKQTTEWINGYKEGRTSGSLAWRASRQELGDGGKEEKESKEKVVSGFHVESFFPNSNDGVTIEVTSSPVDSHGGIVVSSVACAVGQPNCISLVVVDEQYLGCILQSRSFDSWASLGEFVDTLPLGRVVALCGAVTEAFNVDSKVEAKLARLGGFDMENVEKAVCTMFVGCVELHPNWAVCTRGDISKGILVHISGEDTRKKTRLRTERTTMPRCVATRLPEEIMPLQTQLLATESQKRTAFMSYLEKTEQSKRYSGYTTKPKAPVYLLDETSYPFERIDAKQSDDGPSWNTFHLLPDPLVPEDDNGIDEEEVRKVTDGPKFDIPLDASFYTTLLGPNLLVHSGTGAPTTMDTPNALHNARLIGLYFSAHWCGPCRRFTPMLAEMYTHLKEEVAPTHGLEIVFVSSDRDPSSFQQYYGTMPWLAVPYQSGRMLQQQISARYGVRGIPALVVLDAISGEIVVSMSESRSDVTRACQGGDQGIANMLKNQWLPKTPRESQEILEMLELSCADEEVEADSLVQRNDEESSYFVRAPNVDPAVRVKEIFSNLVAEGMETNAAAAQAIQLVAKEQKQSNGGSSFDKGPLKGESELNPTIDKVSKVDRMAKRVTQWNQAGSAAVRTVVTTAQKYLDNAIREPWTSKFRSFKLSNKVVDRITRIEGGIGLLRTVGFSIHGTQQDFMACIPLAADLDRVHAEITRVLEEHSSAED